MTVEIVDKKTKIVTTTKYVVSVPYSGPVRAWEVVRDFQGVPEDASLTGFSDDDSEVRFTFTQEDTTDHDGRKE